MTTLQKKARNVIVLCASDLFLLSANLFVMLVCPSLFVLLHVLLSRLVHASVAIFP